MDLEAISGPKRSDRRPTPIIHEEPAAIVETRALILQDETNPFEDMYKWDVQDKVTISTEARRKFMAFIAQV